MQCAHPFIVDNLKKKINACHDCGVIVLSVHAVKPLPLDSLLSKIDGLDRRSTPPPCFAVPMRRLTRFEPISVVPLVSLFSSNPASYLLPFLELGLRLLGAFARGGIYLLLAEKHIDPDLNWLLILQNMQHNQSDVDWYQAVVQAWERHAGPHSQAWHGCTLRHTRPSLVTEHK